MNEEPRPPAEGPNETAGVESGAAAPESTVRGMLQGAIQKVMDEIEQHEQAARRHLQQAEDLRKELQEGFRMVKQEARAKSAAVAATSRHEPSEAVPAAETAPDAAAPKPARAEARKRLAGRRGRGKK